MPMTKHNKLRQLRFFPYADRKQWFELRTWDAEKRMGSRDAIGYELRHWTGNGESHVVFTGEDFGASPMYAMDSDVTCHSILSFLTLRPGDTDADYFAEYTPEQMTFCTHHAEALSIAVFDRFGEG